MRRVERYSGLAGPAIPGGAFYAFANVKATGRRSKEIADSLLADAGVACLNGAGFGEFGEG